jgi:hypothetical protein
MYQHALVFALSVFAILCAVRDAPLFLLASVVAIALISAFVLFDRYVSIRQVYDVVKKAPLIADMAVKQMHSNGVTLTDIRTVVTDGYIDYFNSTADKLIMFNYNIQVSFLVQPGYVYGSYVYIADVKPRGLLRR